MPITEERWHKVQQGEEFSLTDGDKILFRCCDCALVHELTLHSKRAIRIQIKRDEQETECARKEKFGLGEVVGLEYIPKSPIGEISSKIQKGEKIMCPIVLQYANGRERLINGESFRKLDENTRALGQVDFVTHADGNPLGELKGKAIKANLCEIIEIPEEMWRQKKEAEKEAREKQMAEQAKKQAEDAQKAKDNWDMKIKVNAAWRKRFVLVRIFSKKPYPEVA